MNRPCSKNRFSLTLSLLLALALIPAPGSAEIPLRPFSASYKLYKGKKYIANTELKLERSGEHWRWSSLTTARGIYSWFTRKQPYTETSFSLAGDEFLLREILVTDAGKNKKRDESALFDWEQGRLEVLRKGKRRQLRLESGVYDYQSIHLLAATMERQQMQTAAIDFYRKGKLVKSRLVYGGLHPISVDGTSFRANLYEQEIVGSKSIVRYYYDAENPLLPVRIERLEADESPAILILRQVHWGL